MPETDVIRFNGLVSREWLIYRFPAERMALGTRLEVQDEQAVVMLYDGQVTDTFIEGSYTLSENNLPIIDSFENFSHSQTGIFEAIPYFINLKTRPDILWGTSEPIALTDSAGSPAYIRAYGCMSLKISDIPLFLRETLKGLGKDAVKYQNTVNLYKTMLNLHFRKLLPEAVAEMRIPLPETAVRTYEISETVCRKLQPVFMNCGLDITDFRIQSLNLAEKEAF